MSQHVAEYSKAEPFRRGTHLVVLLHGYGSHEQDLMGLVNHLPQEGITYASVRAPQPVGYALPADAKDAFIGAPALGYQWWPLNQQLETVGFRAIELAVDYVLEWLEPLAANYRSLNLLGFSQGMAIATSIARHRPDLVRTVIGLSGYVVDGGEGYFKDAELTAQPLPLFWGRDEADPIITAENISFTQEWVKDHTALTDYLYAGIGHGIAPSELAHMSTFIRENILN
ncbi:alpha/beta hydrolase [Rothia sp. P5766]|uniref:alpha/beta hydrolase n=1 Tax=Rothia sp. P5766 TaxID=3402656 RepID=UPI003AE18E9C